MKPLAIWFNPNGQINRRTYWLTLVLPLAVLIPVSVAGFFVSAFSGPTSGEASNDAIAAAFLLTALVLRLYVWTNGTAKRCRDRGHRGWLALLNFVPYIERALFIYCGFWPSKTTGDATNPTEQTPDKSTK